MSHWAWFAFAIALAAGEITIDGSFYLVLMAIAAAGVGALDWAGLDLPAGAEWVLFAVGSVLLLVGCRKTLYERVHGGIAQGEEPHWMVGRTLTAEEAVEPGRTGRVKAAGSGWSVRNVGDGPIAAGAQMRVEKMDGVTLEVSPVEAAGSAAHE